MTLSKRIKRNLLFRKKEVLGTPESALEAVQPVMQTSGVQPVIPTHNDTVTKNDSVRWFNDPYLLGKHVDKLFKKQETEQALELVKRHTATANPFVQSIVIKGLSQSNLDDMMQYWPKKLISPMGYTVLFNALAKTQLSKEQMFRKMLAITKQLEYQRQYWKKAKADDQRRESMIAQLLNDFDKHQLTHQNAILQVCTRTSEVGGWEYGTGLFQSMQPDVVSYTTFFKLCATHPDGPQLAKQAFEKVTKIDARLLNAYLNCHLKQSHDLEHLLLVIEQHLGLPPKHDQPSSRKMDINNQLLTTLLYLTDKLNYPRLGRYWFDICTKTLQPDEGTLEALVNLSVRTENYHLAFEQAKQLKSKEWLLRICYEAVESDPSWHKKALKIDDTNLSANEFVHLLACHCKAKDDRRALDLIKRHKWFLQETRDLLDDMMQSNNLDTSKMVLRIEGIGYIQKLLKPTSDPIYKRMQELLDTWNQFKRETESNSGVRKL
ncbi:hypothetical protein EDD86DRAFT_210064 [Gorgonomyces haynaldii]|nr:hypothetical protein EDD86DRAFT_210064 [Gorgonomyces haynaldii]